MDQTTIQWNCRGIRSKKSDLLHIIKKYNPTIIAISETHLKPEAFFKVDGYLCYRADRADGYGGSAIFASNTQASQQMPSPSINGCSTVTVKAKDIFFISIYIPYPSSHILKDLFKYIKSLSGPRILMGDFNIHNRIWGCSENDSLSDTLLDLLDVSGMCLLNTGSPTRRTRPNENVSAVDLTFASPNLATSISWSILSSTYGSDHFPILLELPLSKPPVKLSHPLLKFKLDAATPLAWQHFRSHIDEVVSSFPPISVNNIEVCLQTLINALLVAANLAFPLKNTAHQYRTSPPWWDNECSEAVKSRKCSEKLYCRNMTIENFDNVVSCINITRKLLRKKKLEGWKCFCESVTPLNKPAFVWKQIKKFRGAYKESSSPLPSGQNWPDQFMDKIAPPFVPNQFDIPSDCMVNQYPLLPHFSLIMKPLSPSMNLC